MIDNFHGSWLPLSNFSFGWFLFHGGFGEQAYQTSEHAFNAQKATNQEDHDRIRDALTAAEAKKIGRSIQLRPDWEQKKFAIMSNILYAKFSEESRKEVLLGTGNEILVEGNTWHDQVWGDCRCEKHINEPGLNALGTLLMTVRLRLISERA